MISSKHMGKIAIALTAVILILCIFAMAYSDKLILLFKDGGYSLEYTKKIFNTKEIIDINIIMDENSWNEMLENARNETYYKCDVAINGTTFYGVGIRPKGNTSLSSVARDPDNNRYSFKLEFDQFADGQTCFGLDKLILNNNYADTTNMKEAIIYDMFSFINADAPLYNYAKISVNDEYFGVYLALEAVEESFMLRNYGTQKGYLYKPDGMNHNGKNDENGNREGFDGGFPKEMPENMPQDFKGRMPERFPENITDDFIENIPEKFRENLPEGFPDNFPTENAENADEEKSENTPDDTKRGMNRQMFGGGGFGGGPGSMGGGNLNYIDDELSSYSTIWEGAVNDSNDADHRRVVTALKNVGSGMELNKYLDIDNVLKYMAVHNFSVNEDSLSGSMAHNYYLYESGGMLNILPWDYNLAFGGMRAKNASSMINEPIDDPYSSTNFFNALLENEEYKARYHEYYNKLVSEYVYNGGFEETYNRIRKQIDDLVKTDPNAMCTYEEYTAGADMLYDTILLRAESVKGQLSGAIPSTTQGQQEDSSALIDASHIDTSVMGQFMGGGPR